MQKVIMICDRCGQEMATSSDTLQIRYWNRHASQWTESGIQQIDLCPECQKEFKRWIQKKD